MTYPTEVKAQALALALQGYSTRRIERAIGIDHATVYTWLQPNLDEIRRKKGELLIENAVSQAIQADALIERGLDHLAEQEPAVIAKNLQTLNIISGTAKDKVLNFQRAPQQSINIDKAVIIIERSSPSDQSVASSDVAKGFATASTEAQKTTQRVEADSPETVDVTSICIDSDQL